MRVISQDGTLDFPYEIALFLLIQGRKKQHLSGCRQSETMRLQ